MPEMDNSMYLTCNKRDSSLSQTHDLSPVLAQVEEAVCSAYADVVQKYVTREYLSKFGLRPSMNFEGWRIAARTRSCGSHARRARALKQASISSFTGLNTLTTKVRISSKSVVLAMRQILTTLDFMQSAVEQIWRWRRFVYGRG